MMKRHGVYALLLLSLIGGSAYSQENQLVTGTIVQRPAQQVVSDDTIPAINLSEEELDNIVDIRKQFEKQNKTYSAPLAPSTNLLRFLKKDELEISDEAMYWARLVRDASTIFDNTMTFRDTVIVNPLFMPIVFRGDYLPENLIFYNFDSLKERTPYDNLYRADSIFKDLERNKQFEEMAYKYVQNNYPTYFRQIIQAANRRLARMTSNEFILQCREIQDLSSQGQAGLDLDVYDLVIDSVRDVKSLSGGESFMAALSMALGLADIIQNTAGAVSLETMFVDEGFGSLDDASRDRAIQILKELAGEKGLVGIISHVNELKEQIDWKLNITKTEHGSQAKWEI